MISFWTVKTNMFIAYIEFTNFMRRPEDIYSKLVKFIFIFALPLIVIVNFPAKVMVKTLSPGWIIWAFAVSAILFVLNSRLWKVALKRYESASS